MLAVSLYSSSAGEKGLSNDTQSDQLNGAWNMHRNAQKFDWKTQSKIACNYTWLLHGKICLSCWHFLRIF